MLIEMHAHTSRHSSCSLLDPVILVKNVIKKGLQGLVITEHHYLWPDDELNELRILSEAPEHFVLLSAQEVETDLGHIVVVGADKTIAEKIALSKLREYFPETAMIWVHPFRNDAKPDKEKLLCGFLDAIEIFNGNQTLMENYNGLKSWHKHRYTAVSGSDSHSDKMIGIFPTHFDHLVFSIDQLVGEIRNGRCRPFFKEIPKSGSNIVVNEISFGTKGEDETRNRIILKKVTERKKWVRVCKSARIVKTLYSKGFNNNVFRVPDVLVIDEEEKLVIEEGQRGRSLFELLLHIKPLTGKKYFRMAARWLAKLHLMSLSIENKDKTFNRENKRFTSYRKAFEKSHSPFMSAASGLIRFIEEKEKKIFDSNEIPFVLNHGDYHPKNIIIGQDHMQDICTLFVSVIDFDNSMSFPKSFDVGYFLAQFKNQFLHNPFIGNTYSDDVFLEAYIESITKAHKLEDDFMDFVDFFKLRANMSIAAHLIKVGKGTDLQMKEIIDNSKKIAEKICLNI